MMLLLLTHQWLRHDDADLVLRHGGEGGEEALQDVLAWLALRVHADGHGYRRALLPLGTADRREGRLVVAIAHGRGYGKNT